MKDDDFYNKVSFIARLGSGSGSRSISGPLMIWEKVNFILNLPIFLLLILVKKFTDYLKTIKTQF